MNVFLTDTWVRASDEPIDSSSTRSLGKSSNASSRFTSSDSSVPEPEGVLSSIPVTARSSTMQLPSLWTVRPIGDSSALESSIRRISCLIFSKLPTKSGRFSSLLTVRIGKESDAVS